MLKLNVDAAIDSGKQMAGLGAINMDSNGNCVAAAVKTFHIWRDICPAEAEAMNWGLQAAKQANLSSLIVQSDCQEVVDLVTNGTGVSRAEVYWVISNIQKWCKGFQTVQIQHTSRFCNAHAHALAN